jgi:preprotein translocase subunit SecD
MKATWLLVTAILLAGMAGCSKSGLKIGDTGSKIRATLRVRTDRLPPGEKWDADKEQATAKVLTARLQTIGNSPSVTAHGSTFGVEVSSTRDPAMVLEYLTALGKLEFRHLRGAHYSSAPRWRPAAEKYALSVDINAKTGLDEYSFTDTDGKAVRSDLVLSESPLILSEADLRPVSKAMRDRQADEAFVQIELTPNGRKRFADFSRKNADEILAIVLDGKILSAPTIIEPILNGTAVIRGRFTQDEAQDLADLLNTGRLPAPLEVAK